jgi:hypothetical protein
VTREAFLKSREFALCKGWTAPTVIVPVPWLECGSCGGVAARAELDGGYDPTHRACAECLTTGWVDTDADGLPIWWSDES